MLGEPLQPGKNARSNAKKRDKKKKARKQPLGQPAAAEPNAALSEANLNSNSERKEGNENKRENVEYDYDQVPANNTVDQQLRQVRQYVADATAGFRTAPADQIKTDLANSLDPITALANGLLTLNNEALTPYQPKSLSLELSLREIQSNLEKAEKLLRTVLVTNESAAIGNVQNPEIMLEQMSQTLMTAKEAVALKLTILSQRQSSASSSSYSSNSSTNPSATITTAPVVASTTPATSTSSSNTTSSLSSSSSSTVAAPNPSTTTPTSTASIASTAPTTSSSSSRSTWNNLTGMVAKIPTSLRGFYTTPVSTPPTTTVTTTTTTPVVASSAAASNASSSSSTSTTTTAVLNPATASSSSSSAATVLPSTSTTTTAANSTATASSSSSSAATVLPSTSTTTATTTAANSTATASSSSGSDVAPKEPAHDEVDPFVNLISEVEKHITQLYGKTFAISDVAIKARLNPFRAPLSEMHKWIRENYGSNFNLASQQPTPGLQPIAYLETLKQALEETRTAIMTASDAANNTPNSQIIGSSLRSMHDQLLDLEVRVVNINQIISALTPPPVQPQPPVPAGQPQEREREAERERAEQERTEREAQEARDREAQEARDREARERAQPAANNNVNRKEAGKAALQTSVGTLAVYFSQNLALGTVMPALGLVSATPLAACLSLGTGTIGLGLALGCLSGARSQNHDRLKSLDRGLASAATSVVMYLAVGSLPAVIIGGGAVCAYHMAQFAIEDRRAPQRPVNLPLP